MRRREETLNVSRTTTWRYNWKDLLPKVKMLNLPQIPITTFISRGNPGWWSKEAEWLTARLEKWLAGYRGYTKLRTGRISKACQTMMTESEEDTTSSDESMKLSDEKPFRIRRSRSQPNSPKRHHKAQPKGTDFRLNSKETANNDGSTPLEVEEVGGKEEEYDDQIIEEEYFKQFRQPYGWTDYTKDGDILNQNIKEQVKNKSESVKISRQNSNESCNHCCYEFCCDEKTKTNNCSAHGNNNRKKRGPLEVLTNKISQANSTCDKYFSFKRRQVHTAREDGFFTYSRRRFNYKKPSKGRHKKRMVFGGTMENDPMWPAVLLTFDRGVSANTNMPVTLITTLPETVL